MSSFARLKKTKLLFTIKVGRNGKGSIFVVAGGNYGLSQKSCSVDEMINSIHTIAINAMGESGSKPIYGEECTGEYHIFL